jgi:hypothetical protein
LRHARMKLRDHCTSAAGQSECRTIASPRFLCTRSRVPCLHICAASSRYTG